ncbi:unnamed protein product, partial [Rotaria magnacalcarata]
ILSKIYDDAHDQFVDLLRLLDTAGYSREASYIFLAE